MNSKLERRLEVAAEFRNLGETGSAAEILDKPIRYQMGFQAIKAVIGKGDCFELLADLIEPDTCVMSFVEEEAMQATYRCSYCHNTVDTLALFGYKFQFCPHCGAKITSVRRQADLISPCGGRASEVDEHDARHSNRDSCHQSSTGCYREES